MEVIDLINDGSGLAFGIIGGRSTGVVVKTIIPGGVADRVSFFFVCVHCHIFSFRFFMLTSLFYCVWYYGRMAD